ncbi:MAG: hypothetical protein WD314_04875 [Trueperaceae bacterium]
MYHNSSTARRRSAHTPTGKLFTSLILAPVALLLLGAGCVPGNVETDVAQPFLASVRQARLVNDAVPMRGNPEFERERLPRPAAQLYDALWESIALPEQLEYIEALAASDNLYNYGRLVQTHISSLLLAFRFTGDLALLDRVDELTQLMREQLDDSWRNVASGDRRDGTDGYLNWVWGQGTSDHHVGKDLHVTDEIRTHALIAEVAWAFRLNEDLASPGGVDYGERGDFWQTYLQDHFEAKWRKRNGIAWPRFPFLQRPYVHPTLAFTKYHYYMHRLTEQPVYLREAMRLSELLFGEFFEVDTAAGAAFVWRRSIVSQGGGQDYLMPTDYSSLVIADALSLHLDGFYGWADPRVPRSLAATVSEFIIDNGAIDFARDIGGGEIRAGIQPSSARDWERVTVSEFSINTFALLARWDETGEIGRVSAEIYERLSPEHHYPYIPVGLVAAQLIERPGSEPMVPEDLLDEPG